MKGGSLKWLRLPIRKLPENKLSFDALLDPRQEEVGDLSYRNTQMVCIDELRARYRFS